MGNAPLQHTLLHRRQLAKEREVRKILAEGKTQVQLPTQRINYVENNRLQRLHTL